MTHLKVILSIFISLHMFWATMCTPSGETTVFIRRLVLVIVCGWLSDVHNRPGWFNYKRSYEVCCLYGCLVYHIFCKLPTFHVPMFMFLFHVHVSSSLSFVWGTFEKFLTVDSLTYLVLCLYQYNIAIDV
jgi:hypothetical protein